MFSSTTFLGVAAAKYCVGTEPVLDVQEVLKQRLVVRINRVSSALSTSYNPLLSDAKSASIAPSLSPGNVFLRRFHRSPHRYLVAVMHALGSHCSGFGVHTFEEHCGARARGTLLLLAV